MRVGSIILIALLALSLPGRYQVQAGFVNFETAPLHPVALSPDGLTLAVCNLPDNRVNLFDVSSGFPLPLGDVSVGLDPVSVRFRAANELWVVNHISSTINIVDVTARRVTATLETKIGPADVAFAGTPQRAFVTCAKEDTVQVFHPLSHVVLTNLDIDGDRPKAMAVSPDGRQVYVAIFESGNASTILAPRFTFFDTAPEPSVVSFPGGPHGGQDPPPNDGTHFTPPLNPNLDSDYLPTGSLIVKKTGSGRWMDDNLGDWTEFVRGSNAVMSGRPVGWDMPDRDLAVIDTDNYAIRYATGLMNICMDVAVNPASGKIAVIGTDATNERRFEPKLRAVFLRVNVALLDPSSLTASIVDLNPDLTYSVPSIPPSERDRSIGDPRGILWNAAGTRAYVTGMGSRNLVVLDANGQRLVSQPVELGDGPTGLALDEPRGRLYVWNRFSATLSVLDAATLTVLTNVSVFDPTPEAVKVGRKHLYDTRRTSGLGHISCASCHVDARFDRLAWDLGNPAGDMVTIDVRTFHPMKGPMVTQTLQDMRTPLHWRADRNSLDDFNVTFTDLLGADAMLSAEEMKEFKDFLATIYFGPNRLRYIDNTMSTNLPLAGHFGTVPGGALGRNPLPNGNAQAARQVFERRFFHVGDIGLAEQTQRCDLCHNGDSGFGVEGGPNLKLARNRGLPFKGAQLRNLQDKVGMDRLGTSSRAGFGFMHDGRADTLTRFVVDGLGIGRNEELPGDPDQEIADMVAFLLSFVGGGTLTSSDGDHGSQDTPAAVGRQATIRSPDTSSLFQAMLAQAKIERDGVDLVAQEQRSWLYDRKSGRFQSDRNTEDISVPKLLALAGPDNPITFTATPAGTGARYSIDRDDDGYLNQTEVDYGFDPLNPRSRGSNTPPRFNPGPPYFDTLPRVRTHPGMLVTITNISAIDADEPPQTLTFSLTDDAPAGATIDPATGEFRWTPPVSELPGERRIAVRVWDDGAPRLDRVDSLSVTIVPVKANWIIRGSVSGDVFIGWEPVEGARYAVQYKDLLSDAAWSELAGEISIIPGGDALKSDVTATNTMQRFYRIVLRE